MKIAVVVDRPTQFDAPFFRHAAADALHELVVLFTEPGAGTPVYDGELGTAVSWGFDLLAGYRSQVVAADTVPPWTEVLTSEAPDLIIVNGYTQAAYEAARRGARRLGIPVGMRIDSVAFTDGPIRLAARKLFLRTWLAARWDLFFPVGSLSRELLLAAGIPADRLGLFPYAVDVDAFRSASRLEPAERRRDRAARGLPATGPVVLAVTKLQSRETPWALIEAMGELPQVTLALAGDGPDRPAVEAEIARRGLRNVHLLGYVPYPELPRLYALSDLFVHAPREERWGVSVAEALGCGLPVVTNDRVGAAADLVRDGENGVVAANRGKSVATAIERALRLAPETVSAASERLLASFAYEAIWKAMTELAARRATIRTRSRERLGEPAR